MGKNNACLGNAEEFTSENYDELAVYKETFPCAIPIVNNPKIGHPLEKLLQEQYEDSFFLVYSPINGWHARLEKEGREFFLILIKDAYTFEKYVDFFFSSIREKSLRENRKRKIICFGSTKLLMMNEEKQVLQQEFYANYKNAVAMAFQKGSPFNGITRSVTYFYDNQNLTKADTFFTWDDSVLEFFDKGKIWDEHRFEN